MGFAFRDGRAAWPFVRFWAFISYSHQDAAWSDWLFKALETYRIPRRLVGRPLGDETVPPRLYPVFRDRDELGGSAELSATLIEALTASRTLIVIASPSAARSRWVEEEVRAFRALGREGRVLALIAGGEPHAGGELECFPPSLRRGEPIAADVRPGRETRSHALLKLVAGIIGVPLDELIQRERQRVRARRVRVSLGASAAIAAAGIAWAWQHVDSRIERHVENGRQAMMARDFARAAPWLVSAASLQARLPHARERPYLRAMLGLTMAQVEQLASIRTLPGTVNGAPAVNSRGDRIAIPLSDSRIAVASLLDDGEPRVYEVGARDPAGPQFDEDDRGVYFTADAAVRYLDFATASVREIRAHPEGVQDAAIAPGGRAVRYRFKDRHEFHRLADGRLLARVTAPGGIADGTIFDPMGKVALAVERGQAGKKAMIVDLLSGGIVRSLELPFHPAGTAQFDPVRKRLALMSPRTARSPGVVSVWDYETGRKLWMTPFPAAFRNVAFSPDGRRLATTSMENRAIVWDAATGHVEALLESDAQIRDVVFFPDSVRLLTQSQDGSPRVWNAEAGGQANKLEGLDAIFARSFPLPDGKGVVAIRTQGQAQILRWRLDGPNVPRAIRAHAMPGIGGGLAAADRLLVTSDEAGEAAIWRADDWTRVARFPDTDKWALSPDGHSFLSVSRKTGALRVFDVDSGAIRLDSRASLPLKSIAGWSSRGTLATLDESGRAMLLEGGDLRPRALGTFAQPASIEMSQDGSIVAVVAGSSLHLLDAAQATRLATFSVPDNDPWGIEFSRDGQTLLVNFPRLSQVIDVASRRKLELKSAGAAATLYAQLACDGDFAALTLGNYRFQLHDARTGERLRDFDGAPGIPGGFACDRDAGLIMASDLSGTMTVWRIDSAQPLARFALSNARLWSNSWVAASRTAAVAGEDGYLYLVPVPLETRPVEALEASLRCRVAYRVSGEVLVRETQASCGEQAKPHGS